MPDERMVFDFQPTPCRKPSIGRYTKEAIPINHVAARFREWGHSKLHAESQSLSIPRRICAAMIFFPNAQPREVCGLPDITERDLSSGRKRDEERMRAALVHQVRGIAAGNRRFVEDLQIRGPTAGAWCIRPVELGTGFQIHRGSEFALDNLGALR